MRFGDKFWEDFGSGHQLNVQCCGHCERGCNGARSRRGQQKGVSEAAILRGGNLLELGAL